GIAIALNGQVLPRSQWDATTLCDGQHVEIVAPFQGG
ncbi:MAG: sulfur carrier protein ThiS, partial [Cyanobacteria bacterium HKST-UBA04]|nr:sulfur carrier protein ThiS [Cyanobacteria bacterium HKST-UBA04]